MNLTRLPRATISVSLTGGRGSPWCWNQRSRPYYFVVLLSTAMNNFLSNNFRPTRSSMNYFFDKVPHEEQKSQRWSFFYFTANLQQCPTALNCSVGDNIELLFAPALWPHRCCFSFSLFLDQLMSKSESSNRRSVLPSLASSINTKCHKRNKISLIIRSPLLAEWE